MNILPILAGSETRKRVRVNFLFLYYQHQLRYAGNKQQPVEIYLAMAVQR